MKASITDTQKEINSSDQKISSKELYDAINKASAHKDSCIKLYKKKEEEHIANFSWQDRNKWKVDYPIQHNKIHKQRYVTHQQCLQLSEHIFNGSSLDDLKGFIDVPVRHFTLDEMLEFKKEDELMLKGLDPDLYKSVSTPKKRQEIAEESKINLPKKKTKKTSLILGNISVPKPEPRIKSVPKVPAKKKQKTSPLQQFKTSSEKLKKVNQQPSIAKTQKKPTTKKTNTPKSIQDKTLETNLLQLGKTSKPKKTAKSTLQMGEQLGTDQKSTTTPTPSKFKIIQSNLKKNKPNTDDNSLLSI
ncbi:hypothetical protein [Aquimarina sp. SS2-1]|uniref:hypothetical protein n=1 Tax=Aquimarina besae TaxID=3342247 RepID=UPI00366E83A7